MLLVINHSHLHDSNATVNVKLINHIVQLQAIICVILIRFEYYLACNTVSRYERTKLLSPDFTLGLVPCCSSVQYTQ
jgi:hypothetical protein